MERVKTFYQIEEFKTLEGLPEKIVEKEIEVGESLGTRLNFSKKEYDISENKIILGRINNWYFLGGTNKDFQVFEDKISINLYIKKEFDKANELNAEKDKLDSSWKAYWTREIEII
ncbi:hypothetical protein MZM54_01785 [[Brevibacterium] frigoritolerans]|nr:hypothetical protein [Peribacillus frigoritolerans]